MLMVCQLPLQTRHTDNLSVRSVLTKVIVYAGIAVLATEVLPIMFDLLGWGTRSWVEL